MKKAEQSQELTDAAGKQASVGAARVKDPGAGRTGELRGGEQLRGDKGGGPKQDGIPNVPHTMDETEEEELAERESHAPGMERDEGGY